MWQSEEWIKIMFRWWGKQFTWSLDYQLNHELDYWESALPRDIEIYPCGSRYVCNPPVMNTDIDFLVYTDDLDIDTKLYSLGFNYSQNREYPPMDSYFGDFASFRKGDINLIVTSSVAYRDNFILGTHICKRFNLLVKRHRLAVFDALFAKDNFDKNKIGLDKDVADLLHKLKGPHGRSLREAYRIQHGLKFNT